jgi:integrase/recombinase XerD
VLRVWRTPVHIRTPNRCPTPQDLPPSPSWPTISPEEVSHGPPGGSRPADPRQCGAVARWRRSRRSRPSSGRRAFRARRRHARKIHTLRSLYAFGIRLGYFQTNPFTVPRPPHVVDKLPERLLVKEEVEALLRAARRSVRTYALVAVLLGTGCRISEIAGAVWGDLQLTIDGHLALMVTGKGGRRRWVKIRPDVFRALATWRQAQHRGIELDPDDRTPLFPAADGKTPVSPVALSEVVMRAARAAGIRKTVTAHWLRHAHASFALLHNTTLAQIQEALGHANIAVTSRYLHAVKGPEDTPADHLPFRF